MSDRLFIGVDSGTQSTKVYIFNQKGEVLCSETEGLRPMLVRQLGYSEHPDDDLWDSLKAVLQKVMKKFTGDVRDIKGLGLCTIRCCRVFVKADGTLAAPVMSWMDVRSYDTFEDSEDIAYTSPTSGYITHRLTGEFSDSAANAFQWQFPVDLNTWEWSKDQEYFDSFRIPPHKLMKLQMPGTILGYVTAKAAEATGLPAGLPVVATANDKAVEALGAGLIHKNVGLVSLGTYITTMICGDKNEPDPKNFFTNLSCIPNRYLYEGNGIRYGMKHITWFKEFLGTELAERADAEGIPVELALEKEALLTPAGADGLLILPDWLAPADQLYRKGVMIGFDVRHTRGHVYRAFMEAIALTLKNGFTAMNEEVGSKAEKVIISGGGSNSDLFMQIFADVFNVTTVRNKMNGSAAMGSAICAAVATGEYADFDTAVAHMIRVKDEFVPNRKNHELYSKINEKAYRDLPQHMEETLQTIFDAYN
ncbi:MAG: FGGY-family carbohydrate kinase [Lachnospiraceae bacterium]